MQNKKKKKILMFLWHPTNANAGGYIRIQGMLPYFHKFSFTVIDNYPSIFHGTIDKKFLREYRLPKLIGYFYRLHFILGRFVEWFFAYWLMVKKGFEELNNGEYEIIYSPTGDIPHITIAGVTLKLLFGSKKLLLDVLNLESLEMNWKDNIREFFQRKSVFKSKTFPEAFLALCVLFVLQRTIVFCDFIVTVSPYMKKVISKYYPWNKIEVTPSGVTEVKTLKNKNIKIYDGIYVGRYTPEKGIFDLLKTWREVLKSKKNAQLALVGFCDREIRQRMGKLVQKFEIEKNVEFIGFVDEKGKWDYLRNASIFIHLAYFEPLVPVITLLEASAAGLPVVMYDVSSLNDYPWMRKEPSLKVVTNGDYKKAAREIISYLSLTADQKTTIQKKAKQYAQKFSWEKIAKIEEQVMLNLV